MTIDYSHLPLRPCVGIMLINREGKIFTGQRCDRSSDKYWQMPQGGIDAEEESEQAAFRELDEETGTNNAEILQISNQWLDYELPSELVGKLWSGKYRGQSQKWFLMRFLGQDNDFDLNKHHPEFDKWCWQTVTEMRRSVIPFKQNVYNQVFDEFSSYLL